MKKLITLLLVLLLTFSLVACGNEETPDPSGSDNPGVSQSGENNDNQGESTDNDGEENNGGENTEGSSEENNGGENADNSGIEWPSNEYTAMVPELPASILAICTESYVVNSLSKCGFSYYDVDPSLEDLQNYMQALKDAGFTVNMNDEMTTDASGFMFYASNDEGWKVKLTNDYFTIEKLH